MHKLTKFSRGRSRSRSTVLHVQPKASPTPWPRQTGKPGGLPIGSLARRPQAVAPIGARACTRSAPPQCRTALAVSKSPQLHAVHDQPAPKQLMAGCNPKAAHDWVPGQRSQPAPKAALGRAPQSQSPQSETWAPPPGPPPHRSPGTTSKATAEGPPATISIITYGDDCDIFLLDIIKNAISKLVHRIQGTSGLHGV